VTKDGFSQVWVSFTKQQMVLQYVRTHGRITRKEAVELCRISEDQASRLLRKLTDANQLKLEGQGRASYYVVS
jgi:ATP-dependent DNA helicase RecG